MYPEWSKIFRHVTELKKLLMEQRTFDMIWFLIILLKSKIWLDCEGLQRGKVVSIQSYRLNLAHCPILGLLKDMYKQKPLLLIGGICCNYTHCIRKQNWGRHIVCSNIPHYISFNRQHRHQIILVISWEEPKRICKKLEVYAYLISLMKSKLA
jgi:hypothetical protein